MSMPMTGRERSDLQSLARMNARVSKADVDAVVAARYAAFENDLARDWTAQELEVEQLIAEAQVKIDEINAKITAECDRLNIRPELRPRMGGGLWTSPRASREREIEFRRKAKAELEAAGKRAKVEIDRQSAAVITQIVSTGLTSNEATAMLGKVATPEDLVPTLDVRDLEALVAGGGR